jgi:hypothetical protein
MSFGRILVGALALPASLACDLQRAGPSATLPGWEVATAPRFAIGDRDADGDTAVFYRVDDARWHEGRGVLVVADGGAFGIRVYAPDGTLRAQGGRRGRGPAEFSGRLALMDAPGDSVAVWDSGQGRWTMFNVVDGGMRNVMGEHAQPVWFQAGLLVLSDRDSAPAWVAPLLMSLPDTTASRVARIDRSALLFLSQDAALRTWHVHRDSAAAIATVTLPPNFTLTHVGDDEVIGIVSDSLGLEQVVVHELRRGAHEPADPTPSVRPAMDEGARNELRSFLRNTVVAQEVRYAERGAYTAFADSLRLPQLPEGARMKIIQQTDRGWSGVAWHPSTGLTCGMIIGLTTPPGWMEGEARCGR